MARGRVAPADEYFGHYKMSVLEINNRLHDCEYRAKHGVRPSIILGDAGRTADAMADWEHKYPTDPWLPHFYWRLALLYSNLPSATAHAREPDALMHYHRVARAR